MQEKLIELLNRYITEYEALRDDAPKLYTFKTLYEELLNALKEDYQTVIDNKLGISFLITTLYSDDIYLTEFYESLVNIKDSKESKARFKRLIKNIDSDYQKIANSLEEANLRVYRSRYLYQSAKRAVTCLTYNMPLNGKYDVVNVKRILNYFETIGIISNKEELLLLNETELHNRKSLLSEQKEKTEAAYIERLYNEIPNILNAGYEEYDKVEVSESRKPSLDKFVKEILGFINHLDRDEITSILESYHSYNIQDNEYAYIITKILNYYQDSLLTFYELLMEKDIYTNIESRVEVIKNYYSLLDTYLVIRKYYDELNTFTIDEPDPAAPKVNTPKETRALIFSHSPNSSKARAISDMKDIPNEYYNQVTDLLTRFKTDELSSTESKKFSNHRRLVTIIELRNNDQIRIILKHIKGNLYCVMGIAVKKDDNDAHMYNTMANRSMPDTSTEEALNKELAFAKITEDELTKLVKEKGRKGNR